MFQKIQWDLAGKTYHCNEATRIYHESIGINCKSIVYGKARLEFGDCYSFDNDHNGTVQAYLNGNEIGRTSALVLTSLESLGRDETFKSLESLVRLFKKVSKIII